MSQAENYCAYSVAAQPGSINWNNRIGIDWNSYCTDWGPAVQLILSKFNAVPRKFCRKKNHVQLCAPSCDRTEGTHRIPFSALVGKLSTKFCLSGCWLLLLLWATLQLHPDSSSTPDLLWCVWLIVISLVFDVCFFFSQQSVGAVCSAPNLPSGHMEGLGGVPSPPRLKVS